MKKLLKHPWIIISAVTAITVFFALQLKSIEIQNTMRLFMPQKGDSYIRLHKTEDQFGSMILLGISLETTQEESVITPENISIIQKITEECEKLDLIEDVDSLTNVDFIYGREGSLNTGDLLGGDDYTGSANDMNLIRQKIIDWQDMYHNVILSDDGKITQIMLTVNPASSSTQQVELLKEIRAIVEEASKGSDLTVRLYGDPVQSDEMRRMMMQDLLCLIPLVILVVIVTLYISFHSLAGTFLPLLTVLISTIWSVGLMALLKVTFTLIASVIPVALIACGSAYGIHIISHYYEALSLSKDEMTKEKHLDVIMSALKNVSAAVLLAGITTIAGFVSLVTSPLVPLQSFAAFTALGVGFALLLSVTLIPAILYLTPLNKIGNAKKASSKFALKVKNKVKNKLEKHGLISKDEGQDTPYNIYKFFAGTPCRITLLILAILIVSAVGIKKLVIDTAMINYFPENSRFRKDVDFVDENLTGTNSLFFLVTGQENGDLTKPEILKSVEGLQQYLEKKNPEIGKIVSFTTFIKRINQVMHVPALKADTETFSDSDDAFFDSLDFGDESGSFESFASDDSFDSFASDEDFEDAGFSSFAESSDIENFENSAEGHSAAAFVDPNIAFAEKLNEKMSVAEFFQLLQKAYVAAGGRRASVENIVKEMEKSFNFNGIDYYEIPYNVEKYPVASREELSDLVSQYLLLYSGTLDKFADNQLSPKQIRIQVQIKDQSTLVTGKIIEDAKQYAAKYFPKGYTIEATGNAEMQYTMAHMVVTSQMTSIAFSILMVFVILSISFKSPWAGIIGALPLIFTIMLNFMVMGFANIHLDLITSIIASVAIGIGIDYTIHFLETYKAERALSSRLNEVTKNTFRISGQGIITNALAVGLGFAVLLLSKFIILRCVGILVAIVMFTSSSLALTVIPGILNTLKPKFMNPKVKPEQKTEQTDGQPADRT